MVDETILENIYHGREERNLEYKQTMSWTEASTKAKITKCVMAMSNIRDGGSIVEEAIYEPGCQFLYSWSVGLKASRL
jgi:hypothetical protein